MEQFEFRCGIGTQAALTDWRERGGVTEYSFHISWSPEAAEADEIIQIRWFVPVIGFQYLWSPLHSLPRTIPPDWNGDAASAFAHGCPVSCLFDGQGQSHYLWQLSECRETVFFHTGITEENGCAECRFSVGTRQFTARQEADIILRTDKAIRPMYECLRDAALWWERDLGMAAAPVPEDARLPCYSFWYSHHQQVYAQDVEAECRRAKALGFSTCIIDDGWQTADNGRGYAYCGDWQPAPEKIPDMAAHVKAVHDIGMKYILWYAVPLIGRYSIQYQSFSSMLLRREKTADVLDPRYPQVRSFLIDIYKTALRQWDLDGFKLDFIDCWEYTPENAPANSRMDIPALGAAVETFMQELSRVLRAIKPDILLEFRQNYIGPHMRTFGNMFRVGDCPDDYITNRVGLLDLRMMMGASAVHSDMLMWHPGEKPETAALQFISVLFGTVQYSAKLSALTPEMQKMSLFWLNFLRSHAHLLQSDSLQVYDPHLLYSWAQVTDETTCIAAVYMADKCISPASRQTVYVANGAECGRILLDIRGSFTVTVQNACGEIVSQGHLCMEGVSVLAVPAGGLATLTESE